LQNRLILTSQTGGQRYSDTSPFSIPWFHILRSTAAAKSKKDISSEKEVSSFEIGSDLNVLI
jgi:hypothetical protein